MTNSSAPSQQSPTPDLWVTSPSIDAGADELSSLPSGAPVGGVLQGTTASRPKIKGLLRQRLMLVTALALGASAAALLVRVLAINGQGLPAELRLETRNWLDLGCLAANLCMMLLLWKWRGASETALRGLDLTLFLLNLAMVALIPLLVFGPQHPQGQAVGTILLIRCIFIPDTPLRTFLVCAGLWLLHVAACVISVQVFSGAAGLQLGSELLWLNFVDSHFTIGLNLAIGMVAVRSIYGLRLRLYQVERAGAYRLLEKLGEGGMGEVWRARHALLQRPTAVKMIRADLIDSLTAMKRFEREVRAVSELTDPHTIVIYDCGNTDGGRFYYAMEFLEGLDLQRMVERFGPLPPGRVVFLLEQALSSLSEAHRRGILHRDIKPSNVFLTTRGTRFDFVKVLDFGLVKHLEQIPDSRALELTGEDSLTGSPLYLAPEWVYGNDPAGHAADLYSVGAVAYFLLAGHPVFASRTPMAALVDHVKTQPVSLRERGVAVSEALDLVVLKTLEKLPGSRFRTAEELLDALRGTPEWGSWTSDQAAVWWQKHLPVETLLSSQPIFASP